MDPIKKAAEVIGSQREFALLMGVTPGAVSQWIGGKVPAERCPDIERATNGLVRCEELRPDLAEQWAYLRSTSPQDGMPVNLQEAA